MRPFLRQLRRHGSFLAFEESTKEIGQVVFFSARIESFKNKSKENSLAAQMPLTFKATSPATAASLRDAYRVRPFFLTSLSHGKTIKPVEGVLRRHNVN